MFLEPIDIPQALNTGTCIWQGDLFYSAGLHRNHVLATANTRQIRRGWKNADEWNGGVEISTEEIPGSKHSMYGYNYTDLPQAFKGEPLSSVFSPDGTLISASTAPHCRVGQLMWQRANSNPKPPSMNHTPKRIILPNPKSTVLALEKSMPTPFHKN